MNKINSNDNYMINNNNNNRIVTRQLCQQVGHIAVS
jgi:hypothetical protein